MTVMRDVSGSKTAGTVGEVGERRIVKLQDFQDDEQLFTYCTQKDVLKYVR
jgi:hypothetical protein